MKKVSVFLTGVYYVSASVWLAGFGTNGHPGSFTGSTYDYEDKYCPRTAVRYQNLLVRSR